MDEKQTTTENQSGEKPADNGDGNQRETTRLIDDANIAAKRMEEANKNKKELLDREETLMAKKALGGTSEAGGIAEKEKETPEAYAERFQRGEVNPLEDDGVI